MGLIPAADQHLCTRFLQNYQLTMKSSAQYVELRPDGYLQLSDRREYSQFFLELPLLRPLAHRLIITDAIFLASV